ncbi:class B sortase [Paenibacillus qinlingensis]|uniref:class B sortase n=1 Tax=Paenibacillus qinlingensis TaxID=1837343 RepID=UPI001FE3DB20|nr:class B sortase [Paenibacillus qinlingensis]
MCLTIAIFLYAACRLILIGWGYYENHQVLAEASDIFREAQSQELKTEPRQPITSSVEFAERTQQESVQQARGVFQPLLERNPDIVGWIQLDGSRINNPVMQGPDNEWYLYRNFKGEYAKAGSIFMDYRNERWEPQRNLVLYGHRMKDGTMFGDLKNFLNPDYYDAHRQFRLDTLDASYLAEIFSVYDTTVDFNYIETEFVDAEAFQSYLTSIEQKSLYRPDIEVTSSDQIVTLSTCDYRLDPVNGRFVVHARLKRVS